jgi:AcrR family transcriptional regulator
MHLVKTDFVNPIAVDRRPKAVPTPRLKSVDRREEILNAASTLFIEHGPSKTTTRQIAQAVGISQPSLYAHFPTKEALAQALATRAFALLEARMENMEALHIEPAERLAGLIKGYINFALEEPAAYKIAFMLDLNLDVSQILCFQEQVGMHAFSIFRDKIGDLQVSGQVKSGDTNMMAQSIWAAMHGLCALLLARPHFPWVAREVLIAAHIDLIARGAAN